MEWNWRAATQNSAGTGTFYTTKMFKASRGKTAHAADNSQFVRRRDQGSARQLITAWAARCSGQTASHGRKAQTTPRQASIGERIEV